MDHLYTQSFTPIPGVDVGTAYLLAEDYLRVGGDLIDIYQFNNGSMAISVADISGKGAQAARRAALVKYGLRAYVSSGSTPAQVLRNMNLLYMETSKFDSSDSDSFVSIFLGIVDPELRVLTYASAGHDPVLLFCPGRATQTLAPTAPVVGVFEESQKLFHQRLVYLEPGGSTLVVTTDGVTEARSADGTFISRDAILATLDAASLCPPRRRRMRSWALRARFAAASRSTISPSRSPAFRRTRQGKGGRRWDFLGTFGRNEAMNRWMVAACAALAAAASMQHGPAEASQGFQGPVSANARRGADLGPSRRRRAGRSTSPFEAGTKTRSTRSSRLKTIRLQVLSPLPHARAVRFLFRRGAAAITPRPSQRCARAALRSTNFVANRKDLIVHAPASAVETLFQRRSTAASKGAAASLPTGTNRRSRRPYAGPHRRPRRLRAVPPGRASGATPGYRRRPYRLGTCRYPQRCTRFLRPRRRADGSGVTIGEATVGLVKQSDFAAFQRQLDCTLSWCLPKRRSERPRPIPTNRPSTSSGWPASPRRDDLQVSPETTVRAV